MDPVAHLMHIYTEWIIIFHIINVTEGGDV